MQSIRDCYNRLETRHRRLGRTLPIPEDTFLKNIFRGFSSPAGKLSSKNFTNGTWEMFARVRHYAGLPNLFGKLNHAYFMIQSGDILARINIGGTNRAQTLTNYGLLDKWVRYSFVSDGSTMLSYVNGILIVSNTFTGTLTASTSMYTILAVDTVGGGDGVEAADFRIWSVARTQQEILDTLPLGAIKGPMVGLETCIEFDNINGSDSTIVNDYSGNNWNVDTVTNDVTKKVGVVKL
jgi:hypothetical protein